MTTPWIEVIRSGGQLSVHFTAAVTGSAWAGVTEDAVRGFNRLSRQHRLGVQLVTASESTANITVNIADGSASFSIDGQSHTISLPGRSLQGHTANLSRSGALFQSYVFLPSDPQVNTPSGPRSVGEGVRLVIAVHEFIHCCGLDNSEHSSDDIFTGFPSVDYGSTPSRDVVVIQAAGQRRRTAPPLFLGATTISRVRRLWAGGASGEEHASASVRAVLGGAADRRGEVHGMRRRPGPVGLG